ncbi:phenylalanine--tRNA ligase subunit beta, partial [Candidatus Marinimicrobia bacterium]|nr:phenylalanine--tRNA ligase subunit beta [Candidatus Neomarinimicrobiota bacterium]
MIASLNWLKEIVDINTSNSELLKNLTNLGLECTSINTGPSFENVYVGKIINVKKHKNSEHLFLCSVDVGDENKLSIVCGAPNVKKEILVPVAVVGAKILNGKFKIKKSKIRGEYSHGMICSEKELEVGEDDSGIMILDNSFKIGEKLEVALNLKQDTIIDFDLTPNRGDCLSYLGIAREIAILESQNHSIIRKKMIDSLFFEYSKNDEKVEDLISINVEDVEACPVYNGKIIKGINVKESPSWLKSKLKSHNMKSINIVVDLANYVMLSLGQPMHTFDYDKIHSNQINVDFAKNDTNIKTLDSQIRKLSDKNLLIKDGHNPIAIAGVIGGQNTEIDSKTKNVFIESALFEPKIVRKSAKSLDLSTDASRRYERSVDSELIEESLEILCGLIIKYCGGKACQGLLRSNDSTHIDHRVTFKLDNCNGYLGTNLKNQEVSDILHKVGIKNKYNKNEYDCFIPSYRAHDVSRDVDIYEEIARVYGFDNIKPSNSFSVNFSSIKNDSDFNDNLKLNISSKGFIEHYSNSLLSDKEYNYFAEKEGVFVSNPLNVNMKYVRNSIAVGLIRAVSFNQSRKIKNFKLFEIGATYKS